MWLLARPTVNAHAAYAGKSGWDASPWSPVPVRCGRRGRRGASRQGPGPCDANSQAGRGRRRHGVGTGRVSSAPSRWQTLTGGTRWKRGGCSSCGPARGPSRPPHPPRLPQPQRPHGSPSLSSAWKPAGWPVRPTPRPPSLPLQAVGRGGGAVSPARGALMRSPLTWGRSVLPHSGRVEAVPRKARPPRARAVLGGSCTQKPSYLLTTRTDGPSEPRRCRQRRVRIRSGSRPPRSTIARWNPAVAGASIPRR